MTLQLTKRQCGKTCKSKIKSNSMGIAQGSILGPILFIIFVNDLSVLLCSSQQHIVRYADDTNLITGCKTLQDLIEEAQEFFSGVTDWFKTNRLILNEDKTRLLLLQSYTIKPNEIRLGTKELYFSNNSKLLGVLINEHLD